MPFQIRMGVPEMDQLWLDLSTRSFHGGLDKEERKFFKKLVKTLGHLASDPRHNSHASHEIQDLSRKYGIKIFQSYLENNTPSAGRLFWAYGPDKAADSSSSVTELIQSGGGQSKSPRRESLVPPSSMKRFSGSASKRGETPDLSQCIA